MIDEGDWSRLARYFAAECSPEEAEATRAWLAQDEERQREADVLWSMWTTSAATRATPDTDAAWQRLAARVQVTEGLNAVALHTAAPSRPIPKFFAARAVASPRSRRAYIVAAATVIFAVGVLAISYRAPIADVLKSHSSEPAQPAVANAREFRTARGQRAVVVLGDGSRVELGPESSLRVHPFRAGPRELVLEGLAAFEVVHDSLHPFIVHSANAITEDLGTRFTVRAYPHDATVRVLVTSGRVTLRAIGAPASSGTLLGPEDLGVLDSSGRTSVRNDVDSAAHLAWTRDRFVFDNERLSEVLEEIGRWFDVRIVVTNPELERKRITMNVPARSLADVLGEATVPLGLHFTISDSVVVIR